MAKTKKDSAEEPLGGWHRMVPVTFFWNYDRQQHLTALRDMLLPKLMSGEVRVEMEHAPMQ